MTAHQGSKEVILRENSEWLRYVFWAGAIGLGILAIQAINADDRDFGKIIGSSLGALFFGFSGFVFRTRLIAANPTRRKITITNKNCRKFTTETVSFDEIKQILLVMTLTYDSELTPSNRWQEGWTLALMCNDRSVALTLNPASKPQVLLNAEKIQRLVNVDITDSIEESIAHCIKNGKKIDAIALATQKLGMTVTQAKDYVEDKK